MPFNLSYHRVFYIRMNKTKDWLPPPGTNNKWKWNKIKKIKIPEKERTLKYHWDTLVSQSVSSVAQSCPTLCDPMNHSTPGLPVHDQLPEFTQTHVHRVSDAIQPPHPPLSPSPLAPNPSQHQSLFRWVNSSHEVSTHARIHQKTPMLMFDCQTSTWISPDECVRVC